MYHGTDIITLKRYYDNSSKDNLSNDSSSNDSSSNKNLSNRQLIEPTVYRTTIYRATVYRTDSLSNDNLSSDSLSKRQFIERQSTHFTFYKVYHLKSAKRHSQRKKRLKFTFYSTRFQCMAGVYRFFSKFKSGYQYKKVDNHCSRV